MGNKVSNDYLGAGRVEITSETGTTPKQLYRNTDYTYLKLTQLILTNGSSTQTQKVALVDADITDSETTYMGEQYLKMPSIVIGPQTTLFLTEEDFGPLYFRYGVCGYNSTSVSAGSGIQARVVGEEIYGQY